MIGGVIMAHGDNDGLILPPKIASTQIVLVPLFKEDSDKTHILEYSDKILQQLKQKFDGLLIQTDKQHHLRVQATDFFNKLQNRIAIKEFN